MDHLLRKLADLPIEEHGSGSLHLCYSLTRAHWSKIQDVGVHDNTRMALGRLVGTDNLDAILNNSERSSSSSVASTEVHVAEDNNAPDQDLDMDTMGYVSLCVCA